MRTGIITLCVVALTAGPVWGQQAAPTPPPEPASLTTAQAFRCTFTLFVATHWVDGEPETVAGDDQFAFTIEAIDRPARRARIVGATASATASAFVTDTGLNVIEQTPIGNFILTTVFANGRTGDRFMAVHSRHLGDLSAPPGPSQYFGSCEVVR
jgi:hypothetical protein